MFARFLEVSVSTDNIAESLSFYEGLGFFQLSTGETWTHPYGVVSDGHLHIGVHEYDFESPSLTFVRPDLASELVDLKARGIRFEFEKTGDDEFNEVGFFDPGGQMITVLEARTYSPASDTAPDACLLGALDHLALPANELEDSAAFWFRLGLDDTDAGADAGRLSSTIVAADGFRLGLYEATPLARLAAVYVDNHIERRIAMLEAAGFKTHPNRLARGGCAIRSPDGLDFLLQPS